MQRTLLNKTLLFVTTTVTFATVIAVLVIRHQEPRYRGRSATEWFDAWNLQTSSAFRAMGTKAVPFILQKLDGTLTDRLKACAIVQGAFTAGQVEHSQIPSKLESMLASGREEEEVPAYWAMRRLGLPVSNPLAVTAAQTAPSINADLADRMRRPKLAELHGMTATNVDCAFIARLCTDTDPVVQREAISFLGRLLRKDNPRLCNEEVMPSLASVLTNTTDFSVQSMTLICMTLTPELMHRNLPAICNFLEVTGSPALQMDCLGIIAALSHREPLLPETRQCLESLRSRSDLDPSNRRELVALLDDRAIWIERSPANPR